MGPAQEGQRNLGAPSGQQGHHHDSMRASRGATWPGGLERQALWPQSASASKDSTSHESQETESAQLRGQASAGMCLVSFGDSDTTLKGQQLSKQTKMQRNEGLTRMLLKNMLSKKKPGTKGYMVYGSTDMKYPEHANSQRQKAASGYQGLGERGIRSDCLMGTRFLSRMVNMFWN